MKTRKNSCQKTCKNKILNSILKSEKYKTMVNWLSFLGITEEKYHDEVKNAVCKNKDKEVNNVISKCEKECSLKKKTTPKKKTKKK